MNEDLKKAYELAKEEAQCNTAITPAFLQKLNATLMRTTGGIHNTIGGSFDSSRGEFRLCGVTAGVGGRSYMGYQKVSAKVEELCFLLQERQKSVETFREQYELSFNAHLNLVTIHPWVDGNGRAARLLMNYIQFCYHLFPLRFLRRIGQIISFLYNKHKMMKPASLFWISWRCNWKNHCLWKFKNIKLLTIKDLVLCFNLVGLLLIRLPPVVYCVVLSINTWVIGY